MVNQTADIKLFVGGGLRVPYLIVVVELDQILVRTLVICVNNRELL